MTTKPYPKYEEDHYSWLQATITLLKERRMDEIDVDNIIEDLEDMGISNKHQLINRLAVLIAHLLKWQFQSERQSYSWRYTIIEQRKRIKKHLQENPGLKGQLEGFMNDAFDYSQSIFGKDTGIDLSKKLLQCPYTFEQCMDEGFFPDA